MDYELVQARLRYLMDMLPTDDEEKSLDSDDDSDVETDLVEERQGGIEMEEEISDYEEVSIVAHAASFTTKDIKQN